jgi:alpha-N-arabinofuranosidase
MKKILLLQVVLLAITSNAAKPIPDFLFGQNIEHTRSADQGGLSAQLIKNRKFAGKPNMRGVALMWEAYGDHALYDHSNISFTRHAAKSRMLRQNELHSQVICGLTETGESGIKQSGIGIRGGVEHTFKAVVSSYHPENTPMVLRVKSKGKTIAEREFTVNTKTRTSWTRISLAFTSAENTTAEVSIGVKGRRMCVIGAVSLLPADNFRGMRADVIEHLRAIGTSIVRWPGGNFAGEYRWRDGLIADPDMRAPLQSYQEIETHPHSLGYDSNDIGMEDIIALCERIGAKPFFTINAAWDTPADSADWVSQCRGRVKLWSLGNEMGYGHMEGSTGPKGYVKLVRPHAEAMLKIDPAITIVSSGLYPYGGKNWVDNAGKVLFDVAPIISYHRYDNPGIFDFTTAERTEQLYAKASQQVDVAMNRLKNFRKIVPEKIGISYDEWNIWYTWYHEEGILEGLYAAKMMYSFMRNWEACGLKFVCYFQAINERAINVTPFESHLTSLGEALRLWKGHIGGVPVELASLPDNAFVTEASDGSRYMTFYNFSTKNPCTFRISTDGRNKIVSAEKLVPNGFISGCRYSRCPSDGSVKDGFYELTLQPAEQASVKLR